MKNSQKSSTLYHLATLPIPTDPKIPVKAFSACAAASRHLRSCNAVDAGCRIQQGHGLALWCGTDHLGEHGRREHHAIDALNDAVVCLDVRNGDAGARDARVLSAAAALASALAEAA